MHCALSNTDVRLSTSAVMFLYIIYVILYMMIFNM
jgi:hypothetical protein